MAETTQLDEYMRKNKTSSRYDLCIERDLLTQGDRVFIIDGEFLWSIMEIFEDVCQDYAQYICSISGSM